MKIHPKPVLFACALLPALLTGCSKSESQMPKEDQAKFGKLGQPMPDAAKKFMQQHGTGGPPGAPPSAAPPAAH